jgi:hypothetical protein
MSYKGRRQGNYGNRPSRRPPKSYVRKTRKVTTLGIKHLPPIIKTETTQEEETPAPEKTTEEENKSLGLSFGNQAGNIGILGSKEKKTTKKFPTTTRNTKRKRKPYA